MLMASEDQTDRLRAIDIESRKVRQISITPSFVEPGPFHTLVHRIAVGSIGAEFWSIAMMIYLGLLWFFVPPAFAPIIFIMFVYTWGRLAIAALLILAIVHLIVLSQQVRISYIIVRKLCCIAHAVIWTSVVYNLLDSRSSVLGFTYGFMTLLLYAAIGRRKYYNVR